MSATKTLVAGAVFGALAVTTGAFGAHGLESMLDADALALWETAVRYQMYHALALVGCACWSEATGRRVGLPSGAFIAGTTVFSGTLYALALGGPRWLGAITPIGGTLLIAGWVALAFAPRGARTH